MFIKIIADVCIYRGKENQFFRIKRKKKHFSKSLVHIVFFNICFNHQLKRKKLYQMILIDIIDNIQTFFLLSGGEGAMNLRI